MLPLMLALAFSTPAKLDPAIAKEMEQVIIAVDKALGLESWNEKPCVDRGGQYGRAKDVSADDTRKCAESAVKTGFPQLGKGYVLAILMAPVGPITVIALGIGPNDGWAAYSCDPGKKCNPVRLDQDNKWSTRIKERRSRACVVKETVWLPAGQKACSGGSDK